MSRLASAADYKREMAELEELVRLERETSNELGADFASDATISSLENRLASLRRHLESLTDADLPGHELDVIFSGEPVSGHAIDADFLGTALTRLQALVHSLVNAQFGRHTQKGSWPEDVLRRSSLQVAETFAGSFGVKLETVDEQLELEGMLAIQPAFEDLFDIVSSDSQGADFLEELGPLGPRARSHLRNFMKDVAKANATVDLRWPLIHGEKTARISAGRARDLEALLKRIDETDRLDERVGLLGGVILRTRFFELEDDSGDVIRGRVSADIQGDVRDLFGQRVRATLLVTNVRDRGTDIERETFRLLKLEPETD